MPIAGPRSVERTALKLRRAEEKCVIQYPTRAASFKRLLGGSLRHQLLYGKVALRPIPVDKCNAARCRMNIEVGQVCVASQGQQSLTVVQERGVIPVLVRLVNHEDEPDTIPSLSTDRKPGGL